MLIAANKIPSPKLLVRRASPPTWSRLRLVSMSTSPFRPFVFLAVVTINVTLLVACIAFRDGEMKILDSSHESVMGHQVGPRSLKNAESVAETTSSAHSTRQAESASTTSSSSSSPSGSDSSSSAAASLSAFEAEMSRRRQQVSSVCASAAASGQPANPILYHELFLQRERHLLWCPVYKARSTNWLTNFVTLSRVPKNQKDVLTRRHGGRVNEVARILYPSIKWSEELDSFMAEAKSSNDGNSNKSAVSFVITRHPFYRLVSAYRDKLERYMARIMRRDYYYNLYGEKIVRTYRPAAKLRFGDDFFSVNNHFGTPLAVKKGKREPDQPTFWEFVQFVKNTPVKDLDIHWRPVSVFCSVCSLPFEYILHHETLAAEEPQFKAVAGLEADLSGDMSLNINHPKDLDYDKLTKLYFEQLDESDVDALFRIYEQDFRMFGYTFDFKGRSFP